MCERIPQLSVYSAGVVWGGDQAGYTGMSHSRREPFQQPATLALARTTQGSAEADAESSSLSSASLKSREDASWSREHLVIMHGLLATTAEIGRASGNSRSQQAGADPSQLYLQVWI